jgi:hypothetical protein
MSFYIDPRPFASYGFVVDKVNPLGSCNPGPFSNTTEVSFHNLSAVATDRVFIRILDRFPIADFVVGSLTQLNSLVLMPSERLSITLGVEGNRLSLINTLQPSQDVNETFANGLFPRFVIAMALDPAAGSATAVVNVTYLQARGYTGQGTQTS